MRHFHDASHHVRYIADERSEMGDSASDTPAENQRKLNILKGFRILS
jgi:hypothetical protein